MFGPRDQVVCSPLGGAKTTQSHREPVHSGMETLTLTLTLTLTPTLTLTLTHTTVMWECGRYPAPHPNSTDQDTEPPGKSSRLRFLLSFLFLKSQLL